MKESFINRGVYPIPEGVNMCDECQELKKEALSNRLEKKRDELRNIELVASATSTGLLNDILIDIWQWGFSLVPGTQRIDAGTAGIPNSVSVIVKGPKEHFSYVKPELSRIF